MGISMLILEVNYGFRYESRLELQCRGVDRNQTGKLTELCRKHVVEQKGVTLLMPATWKNPGAAVAPLRTACRAATEKTSAAERRPPSVESGRRIITIKAEMKQWAKGALGGVSRVPLPAKGAAKHFSAVWPTW